MRRQLVGTGLVTELPSDRLGAVAVTADAAWGRSDAVLQIRPTDD